jgi:hypothetical protein
MVEEQEGLVEVVIPNIEKTLVRILTMLQP